MLMSLKGNPAYTANHQWFPTVCFEEHWLYHFEAGVLITLFPQSDGAINCVDDQDPIPLSVRSKGSAGIATLWHISWSNSMTTLPDRSDKVLA